MNTQRWATDSLPRNARRTLSAEEAGVLQSRLGGKRELRDYLASPEWQARVQSWRRDHARWLCYVCGRRDGLDLHHADYSRLGGEDDGDLVPLCGACHDETHRVHVKERVPLWRAHIVVRHRRDTV